MKAFVSVVLAVVCLLAVPNAAMAVVYTVDSTADEGDAAPGGECKTLGNVCTLRAAIEVSNDSAAVTDTILFNPTVFEGQAGDTIEPATPLPKITSTVDINGATCAITTVPLLLGPCVGVNGPGGQSVLTVEADNTSVSRLAITGGAFGINVTNATTGFVARGNWIGLELDGGNGGFSNAGIFLDPNSDGATIGGSEAVQSNVIVFSGVGLDIEGASNAVVRGNYFSVRPDGTTPAPSGVAIEITDSTVDPEFKAEDNEVGAALSKGAAESSECDGGCNVISGSSSIGVDLNGFSPQNEAPASGPTIVRGNHIGLNAAGTEVVDNGSYVGNGFYGVRAGGADHAQVGGTIEEVTDLTETNYVDGGLYGIVSEGGEDFVARANVIGRVHGGNPPSPPSDRGIQVLSQGISEPATIDDNYVRMTGGIPIEHRSLGATITDNNVQGGSVGIWTWASGGSGSLIDDNFLFNHDEYGILIENGDNVVTGNTVFGPGDVGIRVKNPPGLANIGNLIGGDTKAGENQIEGFDAAAIEILEEATEPGSVTEIARNWGDQNEGLFIDLVGGANEGIQPPAIATAQQSSADGMALPGSTVRVFRKDHSGPGELRAFLGEAIADGSGNWKVTYPSVSVGTIVAATQTGAAGGTSELATATAAADPATGGGDSGGKDKGDKGKDPGVVCKPAKPGKKVKAPCPGGSDVVPPQTTITKGPPKRSVKRTVKFKFTASEKGSTFRCKLDRKPYRVCKSPKKYKNLKPGKHVFKVRAVDKAGNIDPTAAKRKFRILG